MSTTPSLDAFRDAPQLSVADLTLTDLSAPPGPSPRARLVVCLPETPADGIDATLSALAAIFPDDVVQIALPGPATALDAPEASESAPRILRYSADRSTTGWVLTAADYAAAASVIGPDIGPDSGPDSAAGHATARTLLLLGDASALDSPDLLRRLADSIRASNADLAVPRFTLGPADALVNSAILYPITRALFGADIRFPLPIHAALSVRMAQRLASVGRRPIAPGQNPSLLWPVAEAALSGFSVRQIETAAAPPAVSSPADFNVLFNSVAGSLFADIEAKAAFWQRARGLNPPGAPQPLSPPQPTDLDAELQPMIESFHLAQANLQEIWSLVLPPQSRLALKKLSLEPSSQFNFEPSLWARVVYDFVLAFHLRTLNRGHLLGALIPLYLAWVASHLRAANDDASRSAHHTEQTAAAFETEKPYLVSRWRWPDRFNP